MHPSRFDLATALTLSALLVGATGCTEQPRTRVTMAENESTTATGTLTPLERGVVRREILDAMREGIDAWKESDRERMAAVFSDSIMDSFDANWSGYSDRGLTVIHVHDVVYLDVTEMTKDGTQALVNYRYNDTSYLADPQGDKVEDLPPIEGDVQFTLELQDGEWKAVRAIAGPELYH